MAITDKDIELALTTACRAIIAYHGPEVGKRAIYLSMKRGSDMRLKGEGNDPNQGDLLNRMAYAAVHAGQGVYYHEHLGQPTLRVVIDASGGVSVYVQDLADTVRRLGLLRPHDLPKAMREEPS